MPGRGNVELRRRIGEWDGEPQSEQREVGTRITHLPPSYKPPSPIQVLDLGFKGCCKCFCDVEVTSSLLLCGVIFLLMCLRFMVEHHSSNTLFVYSASWTTIPVPIVSLTGLSNFSTSLSVTSFPPCNSASLSSEMCSLLTFGFNSLPLLKMFRGQIYYSPWRRGV